MAEGAHVANAWVAIIPSMEGSRGEITKAIVPEAETAGDNGGKSFASRFGSALSGGLSTAKVAAAAGFAAVAGAGLAAGKALLDIGAGFDEMTDNIIVGTGASGDALADMEDQAKKVATALPVSFGDAGQRVADLNTRLGLTGDSLGDLALKFEGLEAIGNGLDTMLATGTLTAFGVAAEDMGAKLDYAWGVSQATGISMDSLFGVLDSNSAALTQIGFSFEESANMAGLLDKAGVGASATMGKLAKSLGDLTADGGDAKEVFAGVVSEIQGYLDSGDRAAALDLATELFGTKGAPQFIQAVESGALSMDALADASLGASGNIMETFDATADWPERWEIIKNKASEALEPLGGALMDAATRAAEGLSDALDSMDPGVFETLGEALGNLAVDMVDALCDAVQWLADHSDGIAQFAEVAGGALETLGGVLSDVVGALGDFYNWMKDVEADLGEWFDEVGPEVQAAFDSVGEFFGGLGEDVGQFVDDCGAAWDGFTADLGEAWDGVCQGAEQFASDVGEAWNGLCEDAGTAFDAISQTVSEDMKAAEEAGGLASSALQAAMAGDWDTAMADAQAAYDTIKGHISDKLAAAKEAAVSAADAIGEKLGFPGLGDAVGGVFDTIQSAMEDPVGAARDFIDGAVQAIQGFFDGLKLELPPIKLPHFSLSGSFNINPFDGPISVPSISVEWYKTGAVFDSPTLIGVGEAGREAVVPLTNPYMDPFAEAVASKVERHGDVYNIGRVNSYSEFRRDAEIARRYGGLECRKAAAYGA